MTLNAELIEAKIVKLCRKIARDVARWRDHTRKLDVEAHLKSHLHGENIHTPAGVARSLKRRLVNRLDDLVQKALLQLKDLILVQVLPSDDNRDLRLLDFAFNDKLFAEYHLLGARG
jgi:hypothetical protein